HLARTPFPPALQHLLPTIFRPPPSSLYYPSRIPGLKPFPKRTPMNPIQHADPQLWQALTDESRRQEATLELIASENHVSPAVMAAAATPLTNKYAEGYPGKRYYGGCQFVDVVENLARDRAKQIFKCEHVNVQPHSGSQANQAVMLAALTPGDTIMGLHLDHGGHLTHGKSVNLSGKWFKAVHYQLNPTTA